MFTCGRRLEQVARQLRDQTISPEVLPVIEIVGTRESGIHEIVAGSGA